MNKLIKASCEEFQDGYGIRIERSVERNEAANLLLEHGVLLEVADHLQPWGEPEDEDYEIRLPGWHLPMHIDVPKNSNSGWDEFIVTGSPTSLSGRPTGQRKMHTVVQPFSAWKDNITKANCQWTIPFDRQVIHNVAEAFLDSAIEIVDAQEASGLSQAMWFAQKLKKAMGEASVKRRIYLQVFQEFFGQYYQIAMNDPRTFTMDWDSPEFIGKAVRLSVLPFAGQRSDEGAIPEKPSFLHGRYSLRTPDPRNPLAPIEDCLMHTAHRFKVGSSAPFLLRDQSKPPHLDHSSS